MITPERGTICLCARCARTFKWSDKAGRDANGRLICKGCKEASCSQ